MASRRPHVVIVVVNLPVERDRRVIRECLALEAAGYRVTVICPRGPGRLTMLPGSVDTAIRSFPQPLAGTGVLSFAAEFAWALLAVTTRLLGIMLRSRVDAVQACNPPDVFWVVALLMRALGRPFVFDHHDLSPELYECKTDHPRPAVLRVLRLFEKLSWRCASAVVSTNESYRELAITRGGCDPARVVVVRNGPTLAEVGPIRTESVEPELAETGPTTVTNRQTIVYLGVINPQDHVEAAVLAAEHLVGLRGGEDWQLVVAGDGECLPGLRELADQRGISDVVTFTGWLEGDEVDALLRSASIAIQPDPPTRMAELSTMAKTVEYVARGLPVVAVDLLETRRTAEDAASYVPNGTPDELAKALDQLLGDDAARNAMGVVARRRFTEQLAWDHQAKSYIRLWDQLLRRNPTGYNSVSDETGTDAARQTRPQHGTKEAVP
ncbi:glycosyltransferase involved in cell wall biosynthesis [Micromonospora pisi]|uniref:Glycosyltransferase involved in cell wall biosynthesis n=1 Tax=Micromonospora pisi TaxID=589240 RepID=A0A495JG90_9ACTN|nr:glycosyltransferase family 4 protein [Micromonospora pisi]RKR88050.1 glycosyltransferase involved in cell wall biosynthesis [Micromonospora pisi]